VAKTKKLKKNKSQKEAPSTNGVLALLIRFKWLFAAILSFVLFLATPLGEDVRARAYGTVYPYFSTLSNTVAHRLGLVPVETLNKNVLTTSELALDKEIVAGQPTPERGCADESWASKSGAKPLVARLYVELLTNRSDVFLTAATLKLNRLPSAAKAVAVCNEGGGEDEITRFKYQVSATERTKLTVSGPGASDEGDQIALALKPGQKYPLSVEVRVAGPLVVDWSSELVFKVNGEPYRINIGEATTAGVDPTLPRFEADEGHWRKR
jgi:hypothetical protein